MAYDILKTKSILATASLATNQYHFVKIDTSGGIALPAAGGYAVGVLQDKPAAHDPGAVCFPGDITKVMVGTGGLTAGCDVATDADGHAVIATSGAYCLGVSLTTSIVTTLAEIIYQPKASKM